MVRMKHQMIKEKRHTHNSIAKTKRPKGMVYAKEKGKKSGDDNIKEPLEAIICVCKDIAKERKVMKMKELEEVKVAEERRAAPRIGR
jgi:hypothetical protein